ncbi:SWR1 complex bromodomain subunit bdf1-like [Drosophila obscura]|uniref:SWR1 complex bromodomain subunit bdf1-like n=1 Tax=Drosophila obscura TaxID=7282 RepID=UPI001BB183DA|nr:SWR1 complex bromodomain subunit bdf1-like [Drosophila obscura]
MNCFESAKLHQSIPSCVEPEVMPKLESMGRYTNKLHWFKNSVLGKLAEKRYTAVFMGPMKNPKYYETIQDPMDIGSIIERIDNRYYQNLAEAVTDFRIMLGNCFQYFARDDPVYKKGIQMANLFLAIMENRPRGPEIRSTKNPRNATLQTDYRKVTKRVLQPETWQSKVWAQLSKIRSLTDRLEFPVARSVIREQCDSLETKLFQGHFATHEQFAGEAQRRFHDFRNFALQYLQTNFYSGSAKKPRLEEPMHSPLKDSPNRKSVCASSESVSSLDYSSDCCSKSCTNSSCNGSSDSSVSSWDSWQNSPTHSEKSYISSSSFICASSSSSYSDPSDFSFYCSSEEFSSDTSN